MNAGSKVNIHWTKLQPGMGFVMLSRTQRLQDIFISGELDVSQIKCDPKALEESKRLEEIFNQSQKEEVEKRAKYCEQKSICFINRNEGNI